MQQPSTNLIDKVTNKNKINKSTISILKKILPILKQVKQNDLKFFKQNGIVKDFHIKQINKLLINFNLLDGNNINFILNGKEKAVFLIIRNQRTTVTNETYIGTQINGKFANLLTLPQIKAHNQLKTDTSPQTVQNRLNRLEKLTKQVNKLSNKLAYYI